MPVTVGTVVGLVAARRTRTKFSASIPTWKPRTLPRPCPTPPGGQRKSKFRSASRKADLDFSAILAAGPVHGPSVVQLRTQDLLSEGAARIVVRALEAHREDIERGALLSIDESGTRVRVLPLRRSRDLPQQP